MIIFVICRNFSKLQTVHGYLSIHRSFLSFQRSFTEFKTWSINVTESQFDISMTGSNRLHLRSWSSRDRAIFRPEYIYMCDERFSVAQPRWAVFDRHCTGSLTRRMGFVTTVFVALITRREYNATTTTFRVLFMFSALRYTDNMQRGFFALWFIQMRRDSRCGSRSIG